MVITKKTAVIQRFIQNNLCYLVGVARLELATPTSRTLYATNCATPRLSVFRFDGAKVDTNSESTKFLANFFSTFFQSSKDDTLYNIQNQAMQKK